MEDAPSSNEESGNSSRPSKRARLARIYDALSIRLFSIDAGDYEMACEWWEGQGQIPPDAHMLPRIGIVVGNESPILISHCWSTDSTIAISSMTVCNPSSGPKERLCAMIKATTHFETVAQRTGVLRLQVICGNRGLTRILNGLGYHVQTPHDLLFKELR
jgi:hypothetical protein